MVSLLSLHSRDKRDPELTLLDEQRARAAAYPFYEGVKRTEEKMRAGDGNELVVSAFWPANPTDLPNNSLERTPGGVALHLLITRNGML